MASDLGHLAHLISTPRKQRPSWWPVPEDRAGRLPALPSYMPGGNRPGYSPIHNEKLNLIVCTLVMTNLHFSISHCADSVPGGPFILMVLVEKEGGACQSPSFETMAPWPAQVWLGSLTTRCAFRHLALCPLFQGLPDQNVTEP